MIYSIPRYPVHLIDVVRLAPGRRVTIRPVLPQDGELQRGFFRSLSGEARYHRFMTRLDDLPETLLKHLSHIDYRGHLALLAELLEDGREAMIGEARYVLDARIPGTCELAIAVAPAATASPATRPRPGCLSRPGQLPTSPKQRSEQMIVESKNPETMVLHAGPRSDYATGAVAVPIFQTTSYEFRSTEHAANLFALKDFGNIYSRIMNPTCDALEQKMAALEGGAAALAVSSGQAASAIAIQNLCRAGDNVVSSTDLYGGTWNLFANTLPSMGIEVRFADPVDPDAFRRATDARTRAYYAETLPNPKLAVFPVGEVAAIGRELGVPLIMDNTAASVICRPLDHGAAIVVHSTTKYIGGHGNSIGGIIVDGGNFDWAAHAERFPTLNTPDPSYHGAVWAEAVKPLGPIAYIVRARVVLLRDIGACMSPFNAFQFIQGLETLPLRMREHCRNAAAVALFLQRHSAVTRVIYPGLHDEPEQRRRATTYLRGGNGGLVGFELTGGSEAGARFVDALKMFYHVANIGDARSLAIHPASTTHSQLSPADQAASGVTPGYVRLSVGIEHVDDIIADLDQALAAATVAMAKAA